MGRGLFMESDTSGIKSHGWTSIQVGFRLFWWSAGELSFNQNFLIFSFKPPIRVSKWRMRHSV